MEAGSPVSAEVHRGAAVDCDKGGVKGERLLPYAGSGRSVAARIGCPRPPYGVRGTQRAGCFSINYYLLTALRYFPSGNNPWVPQRGLSDSSSYQVCLAF